MYANPSVYSYVCSCILLSPSVHRRYIGSSVLVTLYILSIYPLPCHSARLCSCIAVRLPLRSSVLLSLYSPVPLYSLSCYTPFVHLCSPSSLFFCFFLRLFLCLSVPLAPHASTSLYACQSVSFFVCPSVTLSPYTSASLYTSSFVGLFLCSSSSLFGSSFVSTYVRSSVYLFVCFLFHLSLCFFVRLSLFSYVPVFFRSPFPLYVCPSVLSCHCSSLPLCFC